MKQKAANKRTKQKNSYTQATERWLPEGKGWGRLRKAKRLKDMVTERDSGWGAQKALYGQNAIILYTWNLHNLINQRHLNKFDKITFLVAFFP